MSAVECNNCNWIGDSDDCNPIEDFHQRVDPGEITPAGQCPRCGALCSIAEEDEEDTGQDGELADYYRSQASEQYASDDIEIDDNAEVSFGDDGAFVRAWVWVPKKSTT